MIKQHKLFSAIYVAGTALGISLVMVMAILNYVKTANIAPEINRSRLLYAKSASMSPVDTVRFKYTNSGQLSYKAAKELFMPLKTPERVSVMMENDDFASLPNNENLVKVKNKGVDTNYWKIFQFRFIKGKPFSEADFSSGLKVAVISESLARKLFNSTDIVGQTVEYGFKPYRISGVVKDVSYVLSDTYAQLWTPYTSIDGYDYIWEDRGGMLGDINKIFILARRINDFETICNEVNEKVRVYNAQASDWKLNLSGQPDKRSVEIHRFWSNIGPDMKIINSQNILVVFLLLWISDDKSWKDILPIIITSYIMLFVGTLDDKTDIRAIYKLGIQICVSVIIATSGIRITTLYGGTHLLPCNIGLANIV